MAITKKASEKSTFTYQSNPFSLSFNKFGQFFEKNLGWAIALIILPIFGFFSQMLGVVVDATSTNAHALNSGSESSAMVFLLLVLSVILTTAIIVAYVVISVFISGILAYVALENDAGRTAKFSPAIEAVSSRFWRLLLAQLLAIAKIFGWTLLLIIPGIVATFRYALLPYVILDDSAKEKGVKSSHERIKTLVKGRKREVFGVATVAAIIPIVGGINQLVGNASLYRQLQVSNDQKLEKPAVHWLNYFGFILIGFYILLILFIITIFALTYKG
jgi:hypothetical protein